MAKPNLNAIDRLVAAFDPVRGLRRAQARAVLSYYEAAKPSRTRKFRTDKGGPDLQVQQGAVALRTQMRHLEQNHDITKGSLDVLVNNTVGPHGIGVEFTPRRADGSIHTEYAGELGQMWAKFCRRPEVTWRRDMENCQRVSARTWFRDGEMFAQHVIGPVATMEHGSAVPYSLELMEPDFVPFELNDDGKGIRQGVECNEWGRVRAYHVYRRHPGELLALPTIGDVKRIPAERMLHLAELTRIGQRRGVTRYASVINRIEDIKDYEESERVAAKIAAMLTAYVKRQAPAEEGYTPQTDSNGDPVAREISLNPGVIIDTLAVGEEIGLIDSKRPNPNLLTFRNGQLRAFAAGICASYSSVSRNYDGTFSAQRQELVEQFVHYAAITDDFVGMWLQPVVENAVRVALLASVVKRPPDVVPDSEFEPLYIAPSMPWIDPAKEAQAWLTLVQAGFASEVEVIRRRGAQPDAVMAQIAQWREAAKKKGLTFNSDAAARLVAAAPEPAAD